MLHFGDSAIPRLWEEKFVQEFILFIHRMLFIVNDFIIIFLKALLTPQNEKMWNGRSGAEVRCQSFIYFAWNLLMYIYLSKFFVDYYEIKIRQKYKREKDIYDRDIVYKAHHIGGQDLLLLWDFQLFALSKFKVGKTEHTSHNLKIQMKIILKNKI